MGLIEKSINKAVAVSRKLKIESDFYDHLQAEGLYPHDGQKLVLKLLFRYGKKHVFLQCGRNFGKSHVLLTAAILYAAMNPGSRVYIIAPLRAQAYEIYWASGLIKQMIPRHFLLDGDDAYNKSELRAYFSNGSFIKIDGADNEDSLRGIKPNWLGCDEFQAWKEGSYESMEPNLLAHDAVCLKIGTPPDRECYFTHNAKFIEREMKAGNKRYFYMRQPTSANPRISKAALLDIKKRYIERGEEEVYIREYDAIFVPGGASAIFKMFNKDHHVRPLDWIITRLAKDLSKCELWTLADPGSTSVFAVGFFILNRYTGEAFLIDEIYEKDDKLTSTGQIWPRVQAKEKLYFGKKVPTRYYDEAAAWFINELCAQFPNDCAMTPTNKRAYERESAYTADSCSVVKDAFVMRKFYIAEECVNAIEEITNYHKNERGQVATNQPDHIVDLTRYFFHESGWSASKGVIQAREKDDRGFFTPEEDEYRRRTNAEEHIGPADTETIDDYDLDEDLWN